MKESVGGHVPHPLGGEKGPTIRKTTCEIRGRGEQRHDDVQGRNQQTPKRAQHYCTDDGISNQDKSDAAAYNDLGTHGTRTNDLLVLLAELHENSCHNETGTEHVPSNHA